MSDQDHAEAAIETGFWGRCAAGCLVYSLSTGRLLVAHRSEGVLEPNTWGTWGGACDQDETPADTVLRELLEECGLTSEGVELIPSFVFEHASGFRYHNFFAVVEYEFEPELNWESQGYDWFDPELLPSPLHPGLEAFLSSDLGRAQLQNLQARFVQPELHDPRF
jgi:8-oxo-dGTP pyrophosphatase MutT (NUDIX family)